MLNTEFKYYHDKHRELLKKYAIKFVVIKGKKIIGVYNSHSEAYKGTIKTEELGTFLIKEILNEKDHH